jgi:hypothetical protein
MTRIALVSAALVLGTGIAVAQNVPQAQCPYGESGDKECPPAQTPTAEPAQPTPPAQPAQPIEPADPVTPTPPPAQVDVNVNTPTYTEPVVVEDTMDGTLERWGVGISLGGGVGGFTSDTMRDTTNDGGLWGVRVGFGLRNPIAIEASYIGSAQSIDSLGLDTSAVLVGNGVQGAVRLNLLDFNVQPFVFGGVAWRRYSLTNESFNTSDIANDDDVLEIPVGVGVAWKYRGFMLDARGEFRWAGQEDMVPSLNRAAAADMDRYGVSANVGFAF